MDTHLSQVVDMNSDKLRYDTLVKEVISDKQVLARILKYSLEEFSDSAIDDIIKEMDEPMVSKVRVEPGFTNLDKIERTSEEDNVPGEGRILYDIRFSVYHGEEQIKFLINIEAQKSTDKSKLGYEIDNRLIYYLGRMISAQKEVEFVHSNYDELKHVRSIWICMDSADDEDSINRICLKLEHVYGKPVELHNLDKVVGVLIKIRENENVQESKNILIRMLEELLRKESAAEKKRKLEQEFGLVMTAETERRIGDMCNLSDVLIEKALEQGIEQGIAQGIEEGITQGIEQSEERTAKLFNLLNDAGRIADYAKAMNDRDYLVVLYKEFHLE